MRASLLNRKLHRWGSILVALPLLIVIVSGITLQLKKHWGWVQPATRRGSEPALRISFDEVLAAAKSVPEAAIRTWDDVDRLDVRPDRGLVKVQSKNSYEVQIDAVSGSILQVAYRRSDLLESLHDGSFFHDKAKLWVFLPSGVIVLGLWITGMYLWFLPHMKRRSRRGKAKSKGDA